MALPSADLTADLIDIGVKHRPTSDLWIDSGILLLLERDAYGWESWRRRVQPAAFPNRSRSSRLSTLWLGPNGSASTNSTRRGYLWRPRFSLP